MENTIDLGPMLDKLHEEYSGSPFYELSCFKEKLEVTILDYAEEHPDRVLNHVDLICGCSFGIDHLERCCRIADILGIRFKINMEIL